MSKRLSRMVKYHRKRESEIDYSPMSLTHSKEFNEARNIILLYSVGTSPRF